MSFPALYKEVRRMVRNEALQTKTARAIARKAGLRQAPAPTIEASGRPATLIDCFVLIDDDALVDKNPLTGLDDVSGAYQWIVDLSGYTHIRISSSSDWVTKIAYAETGVISRNLVAFGDENWSNITGTIDEPGHPYDGGLADLSGTWGHLGFSVWEPRRLEWMTIPEEARTEARVSIESAGQPGPYPLHLFDSGPFVFSLQVM